jgi:hypothetical protein
MTLYLRYQADIWVEVDENEDDVVNVIVDELTMARPIDVLDVGGAVAAGESTAAAQRIADSRCWPSWDYGSRPV